VRPQFNLRARCAVMALGALGIAYTTAAVSPAAAGSDTTGATQFSIRDSRVAFGRSVTVVGRHAGGETGRAVALEHRPRGGAWRVVATARTHGDGAYRLVARLRTSGQLRVVSLTAGTADAGATQSAAEDDVATSIVVGAALRTGRKRMDVLAGRPARVQGWLRPSRAGRAVALQIRTGRRWRTVARDRIGPDGRYTLRVRLRRIGSYAARVRFRGDGYNGRAVRSIGRLNVYRRAFASWYGPGLYGNTLGCGGTLTPGTLGVASKTLPCGTRVTFRYRGRKVRVRVVDRGPYVGGREYDLTAATKAALGFGSLGTVWSTS
jgi:hypothetical protein